LECQADTLNLRDVTTRDPADAYSDGLVS